MMDMIQPVEATGKFDITGVDPNAIKASIQQLLDRYKLVLVCGPPTGGKSTFLEKYYEPINDAMIWNRENVFNMISQKGWRYEKINGWLKPFEDQLFQEIYERSEHQMIFDGWYLTKRSRYVVHEFIKKPITSVCLVFDGPTQEMLDRFMVQDKYSHMSDTEKRFFLEGKINTFVKPTFNDGWTDIFYFNTFGQEGVKYLKQRVVTR